MNSDYNILAFDTSLSALSCAVRSSELNRCCKIVESMDKGQSEALIPEINKLLDFAGLSYKELDLIVTTRGPGAFAGLRIGLASAKAFSIGLACPVIGLLTLDVLAEQLCRVFDNPEKADVWIIQETKRKDFYVAGYNSRINRICEPVCMNALEIENALGRRVLLGGDGLERLGREIDLSAHRLCYGTEFIDPSVMMDMGVECVQKNAIQEMNLSPVYLKEPGVSMPKPVSHLASKR